MSNHEILHNCTKCGYQFDARQNRDFDCPNCNEPKTVGEYYNKYLKKEKKTNGKN